MKKLIALLSVVSMPAQVYDSLALYAHLHGLSMLAGNDAVICMLFALVIGLVAYWRFRRAS